ncbi:class I SAM-dependent methyltransferase [Candidatus Woesearchaeota archaeon]|nr:class I SAM-dependent methyltransferase [Candidatus Woesearchaeota archaeon]
MRIDYDSIADSYDELYRSEQLNKLRIIASKLKITPKTKILDIGSGTGLSKILGGKITGLEPSEKLLKKSKIRAVRGAAESIPFPERSFDIVISVTSAHNFSDREKAIAEMARVSKKTVVISVLKASRFSGQIERIIPKHLIIESIITEQKDRIFFCRKKR